MRESVLFASIRRYRNKTAQKGCKLLFLIDAAEERRKILALKILERTRDRKKLIVAQPRELLNFEDLQWTSRDLEAMLLK